MPHHVRRALLLDPAACGVVRQVIGSRCSQGQRTSSRPQTGSSTSRESASAKELVTARLIGAPTSRSALSRRVERHPAMPPCRVVSSVLLSRPRPRSPAGDRVDSWSSPGQTRTPRVTESWAAFSAGRSGSPGCWSRCPSPALGGRVRASVIPGAAVALRAPGRGPQAGPGWWCSRFSVPRAPARCRPARRRASWRRRPRRTSGVPRRPAR